MRGQIITASGSPCAGIAVSDGLSITVTDHGGSFSIEPATGFVFCTRPAGYVPDRWFARAGEDHVTFTMTPQPEEFPLRFAHLSDVHLSDPELSARTYPQPVELGSEEVLGRFLEALPERTGGVASVVITGDLTDLGTDREYQWLRNAVERSPVPLHLLPGNHDHMDGEIAFALSRTGYVVNTAVPAAYERNVGPRWYSFDLPGGLHAVALDWHTHELGLDHEQQNAWLRADLQSLPAGTPWILLSHDQPWHTMLDGLPSQPVATFSGHRHTSRVVEVGGTLHVNTPTPLFAGLDFSPPSYRIVSWDGERIRLETRAIASPALDRSTFEAPAAPAPGPAAAAPGPAGPGGPVLWRHQLPGAGHRAPPRIDGQLVLAGVRHEDSPSGAVEALDLATGGLLWRAALRASVKGTPAVWRDTVVAVEVVGDVVSLDRIDGSERWRVPSPDPLRLFAWTDPVVTGDLVVAGDLSHLRALDARTGELRWERRDLAPYHTLVGQSSPVAVADMLVVGNAMLPSSLVALDAESGQTRWPADGAAEIGSLTNSSTPIGTPLYDPASAAFYVPAPDRVVRVDSVTGRACWSRKTTRPYAPATPAATPLGIAVADAGRGVMLLDRPTGGVLWRCAIDGEAPFAMTGYARTPHPVFASPALLSPDRLAVPGLDGFLHLVDARTGENRGRVPLGVPVAAPLVISGRAGVVIGVDGSVQALDLARLGECREGSPDD